MIGLASRIGLIPSDSTARRNSISVIVKGIVFGLFYVFFVFMHPAVHPEGYCGDVRRDEPDRASFHRINPSWSGVQDHPTIPGAYESK